jgi:spectinomycin phosphotransferase
VRTPPEGLDVADLAQLLEDAWQFTVDDLQYEPVGFGSHHWVATHANGDPRFVTVDDLDPHGSSDVGPRFMRLQQALVTARALREVAGLSFVVAPQPAVDGSVLQPLAQRYAAAVYPFVEGRPWPEDEHATGQDRAAVVRLLAQLHSATRTARLSAGVDDLEIAGRADLEQALGRLEQPWAGGPFAEDTRGLLASNASDLRMLLKEHDRLAALTRADGDEWVVTHGEPKADNLLRTDAGPMLIDWDTTLVAPAARDLWMVGGEPGEACAAYAELSGRRVHRDQVTLYRLGWDLADIASYVQWFTAPHVRSADSDVAWNALSWTLRLRDHWPELL